MAYSGAGLGTEASPYLVTDADELVEVTANMAVGVYWKQTADISLSGYQAGAGWTPIGTPAVPFVGQYDGDDKYIRDLYINVSANTDYLGLFRYSSGTLKNIKMDDCAINNAYRYVGVLCGYNNGTISRCQVGTLANPGGVTMTYQGARSIGWWGLVCGYQSSAKTIDQCLAIGSVYGYGTVGALCGENRYRISKSACFGSVSAHEYGGGLAGKGAWTANTGVQDSVSYSSTERRGSFTTHGGFHSDGYLGNWFARCFACGSVGTDDSDSGFNGYDRGANNPVLTDCYFDEDVTGQATDKAGAAGLTSAESKDSGNFANWNFETVWFMLTAENCKNICGKSGVYDALPAHAKDKPFPRAIATMLAEGIANDTTMNALYFGGGF